MSWPSWISRPTSTVAVDDGVLDLVERRDDRLEVRLEEPEREVGAGERSGDGDALAAKIGPRHRRRARRGAARSRSPIDAPCGSSA